MSRKLMDSDIISRAMEVRGVMVSLFVALPRLLLSRLGVFLFGALWLASFRRRWVFLCVLGDDAVTRS
jgi:hypothetical protein